MQESYGKAGAVVNRLLGAGTGVDLPALYRRT